MDYVKHDLNKAMMLYEMEMVNETTDQKVVMVVLICIQ